MKIAELRGKSVDELDSLLVDLKKEQLNLRFQRATGELENTARVRIVRKSVARIMTLLAQPEYVNAPRTKKEAKKPAKAKAEKPAKKAKAEKNEDTAKAKPAKKAAAKKEKN